MQDARDMDTSRGKAEARARGMELLTPNGAATLFGISDAAVRQARIRMRVDSPFTLDVGRPPLGPPDSGERGGLLERGTGRHTGSDEREWVAHNHLRQHLQCAAHPSHDLCEMKPAAVSCRWGCAR